MKQKTVWLLPSWHMAHHGRHEFIRGVLSGREPKSGPVTRLVVKLCACLKRTKNPTVVMRSQVEDQRVEQSHTLSRGRLTRSKH